MRSRIEVKTGTDRRRVLLEVDERRERKGQIMRNAGYFLGLDTQAYERLHHQAVRRPQRVLQPFRQGRDA